MSCLEHPIAWLECVLFECVVFSESEEGSERRLEEEDGEGKVIRNECYVAKEAL